MQQKPIFTLELAAKKYNELKTLTDTADYFGFCLEKLRQIFKKNNIPYQKRQKYECDHSFFKKESPESFYWAGFIAADGNIEKNKFRIKLELSTKDRVHLEKFKLSIGSTAPIKDLINKESRPEFKNNNYFSSVIKFNSKEIIYDLKNIFGITPNKSKTYNLPDNILNNKLFSHFLRGLIDGDGWIYSENNNSVIGLSGTPILLDKIYVFLKKELLLKSGFNKVRGDGLGIMSFLLLEDNKKIVNYIYNNCENNYLNRKKEISDKILLCKPKKIELNKNELIKNIRDNKNIDEMIEQFKCSESTIIRRMREFGIRQEYLNLKNNLLADKPYLCADEP